MPDLPRWGASLIAVEELGAGEREAWDDYLRGHDGSLFYASERFRALLARRRLFDFDQEVTGLERVEIAVAFLALLELRKQGEITISQAEPFAPMRIARADVEKGRLQWTVRSA